MPNTARSAAAAALTPFAFVFIKRPPFVILLMQQTKAAVRATQSPKLSEFFNFFNAFTNMYRTLDFGLWNSFAISEREYRCQNL